MEFIDTKSAFDRIGFLSVSKEQWLKFVYMLIGAVILGWAFGHFYVEVLSLAHRVCDLQGHCKVTILNQ